VSTSIVGSTTARGASISSIAVVRNGVTAGNALIAGTAYYGAASSPPISSSPSETWAQAVTRFWSQTDTIIWRASSVSGGDYTVTITGNGADYAVATVMEVSDLPTDAVDVTAGNNANSSTPTSGTTSVPSFADTLTIAVVGVEGTSSAWSAAGIDLPSGYTNAGIEQDAWSYIGFSFDYRINTSAAAQSASWGTLDPGSTNWGAIIAVYRANGTGSGFAYHDQYYGPRGAQRTTVRR
jgi:hypothetical protein